ncbi:DsbA family protein [Pyrodictium abyssi]|uniref:Thioredoxin-like fold domain-containing protein n=1 Tax=Pyrodictium abyssi TaxID=54256 RepID=A0ABN6ZNE7_9CREN|nr:hypothetical protein PABY_13580 [Pyrodictium abyssi]
MRGKKLYLVVALAAVAALVAGYVLYSKTGGKTLGAGAVTAPAECGSGPAVLVVYKKGQEDLAMLVEELLKRQLVDHLPQGTRFCRATAGDTGLTGLRVYPAILVRAENVSAMLSSALLNETVGGEWRPMRYDYTAAFETQIALQFGLPLPVYQYRARLLVVEGSTPLATIDQAALEPGSRIMALLSAVFVANITGVEYTKEPPAGANPSSLPAAYAVSSDPLDQGVPGVQRLGDNVYASTDIDLAEVFLQLGVAKAVEKTGAPPGIEGHPAIGSGRMHIAIYEDFACPYCAEFYNKTFPAIKEMIDSGQVTFHIVDLIVHLNENVTKLHKLLLCYYNATGDPGAYLDEAIRIYSEVAKLYRDANITSTAEFYNRIGAILEEEKARLGVDPDCEAAALVDKATHDAAQAGLRGTPSFAIWVEGSDRVLYITGYRDAEFFKQLVESLQQQG